MPIYEYECEKCQKHEEVKKDVSQFETPSTCSTCGNEMKKLVSGSTFHLKGRGWHNTEYSKRGPRR